MDFFSGHVTNARRFAADGTPIGGEFPLVSQSAGTRHPVDPTVAVLPDGRLVVTSSDFSHVWMQILTPAGEPSSERVLVSSDETYPNGINVVVVNGDRIVVAWERSSQEGGALHANIAAQAFFTDGARDGERFIIDAGTRLYPWDVSLSALANGRFIATWNDTDNGGSYLNYGVRGQIIELDVLPPATPRLASVTVDVDQVVITGTAEADSLVRVRDEADRTVGTATADALGQFSLRTGSLVDGPHNLRATATDDSRNTSAATAPTPVTIQATLYSTASATLAPQYRHLVLLGAADLDGVGNALGNTLVGNDGANTLSGLGGDDIYGVAQAADRVVEQPGDGNDTVYADVSYVLPQNVENLILTGSVDLGATGNDAANVLIGNAGANTLVGEAGDDIYGVQGGEDLAVEAPNEGFDTVYASGSYALPDNVEALILASGAVYSLGNGQDNLLIGNDGANTLIGLGGRDTMAGGAGNDVYGVDDPGDAVVEGENGGTDVVVSSVSYALPTNVEVLDLVGSAQQGIGNAGDNALNGNGLANLLAGGVGYDLLSGADGDDTLYGGTGIDQLWGGAGSDRFLYASLAEGGDLIGDFTPGVDQIALVNFSFPSGPLVDGVSFVLGAAVPAQFRGPVMQYDPATGSLVYDANGADLGGRVPLATLAGAPALSASDLTVY